MARALRRRSVAFGPRALSARLAELLPGFPASRVCVAFSGGADSTALLGALAALPRPPLELRAVHIDHRLHPHSRRWSAHCRRLARSLAVPLEVLSARIARAPGESVEAAARAVRYRLLARSLQEGEALLTAHHEDDQLETVLLQLLRGGGLAGIAAIAYVVRNAGAHSYGARSLAVSPTSTVHVLLRDLARTPSLSVWFVPALLGLFIWLRRGIFLLRDKRPESRAIVIAPLGAKSW